MSETAQPKATGKRLTPAQRVAIHAKRLGMSRELGRELAAFFFSLPPGTSRREIENDPEAVKAILYFYDEVAAARDAWREEQEKR